MTITALYQPTLGLLLLLKQKLQFQTSTGKSEFHFFFFFGFTTVQSRLTRYDGNITGLMIVRSWQNMLAKTTGTMTSPFRPC